MLFSKSEMEVLCVFHAGTRRATLELLREALLQNSHSSRKTDLESVIQKLDAMDDTDPVALAFEPEG